MSAQQVLECARCNGEGCLPCAHDTTIDCSCPLWECPECEGTGGPDFGGGEWMPDDIHRPPGDGRTSSQGAAVLVAADHLPLTQRWLLRRLASVPDMAPTPSGLAGRSPSGAPVLNRAGGACTSGSEPGGAGRSHVDPSATPSTSEAADVAAPTASTPTQIDPTKEY